jgi:hypothetical protein
LEKTKQFVSVLFEAAFLDFLRLKIEGTGKF